MLLNSLQQYTGGWLEVFVVMIAFDWFAALLALFVLRPLRQRSAAAAEAKEPDTAFMPAAALQRQAE